MKWEVRISYKKGVQESEGETTLSGLRILGFKGVQSVGTAKVYVIEGDFNRAEIGNSQGLCYRRGLQSRGD
jgi:phosphoribosylformylglycinamidine (FGAM) synthase PurS component